jgi:serine protease
LKVSGGVLFFVGVLFLVGCSGAKPRDLKREIQTWEEGSYIVVLKPDAAPLGFGPNAVQARAQAVRSIAASLSSDYQIPNPKKVFSEVIQAGVYELSGDQVSRLSGDSRVLYLEKDQIISVGSFEALSVQNNPEWGLDRIDQSDLPLSKSYRHDNLGENVNVYVIDTGVLATHEEFENRAKHGFDFVDNDANATDCNGHGTHVAGTVAGLKYGVAKKANVFGVRVLGCSGSGSFSSVIAGVEWVANNHVKPAVANMSLGGGASQAIDTAVSAAVQKGVTFVVAAGNERTDACSKSPARVADAITVGSSTNRDVRSDFSNFGSCVDIFAPGSDIKSAWYNSVTATDTISGTSMASPHVAGAAALYLSKFPDASPDEVSDALVSSASSGKLSDTRAGSPNLLLNTVSILDEDGGGGDDGGGNDGLQSGVPVVGLAGQKNEELHFKINVPAGSQKLVVTISGGTGDGDLYVRRAEAPSVSVWQCRPYKNGNSETCTFNNPLAGEWYIMVRGYRTFSGLSLKATF